ncbi:Transcription initiation factor TFIID subunit 2 [Thelohanellus kitauei]|uniref:Transcription initiation factor TFIID subunit 2 n=1 Tax=Thelohanellus kitauei TaxID=669202 RepID=A0A0C2MDP6_THEKT|nr:Transcription initiation factor TFIID subunit 2 [Thelohanellus kitauei]
MTETIHVESKFESQTTFLPSKYDLFIKEISIESRLAQCELSIEGRLLKAKSSIKFTCVSPIISRVEISVDSSAFTDLQFERVYEEFPNIVVEQDSNKLIEKRVLVERILNMDDSFGGNNLSVHFPHSIQYKITPSSVVKIRFYFSFNFDNGTFDPHYLDVFFTPSTFNFPSGGYRPCIWMPCHSRTMDGATWNIRVNVQSDMCCVCSGNLIDVRKSKSRGSKLWTFRLENPTIPGNIFICVGHFNTVDITDGITGYATKDRYHLISQTIDFLPNFIRFIETSYSFEFTHKLNVLFLSREGPFRVFSNVLVVPTTLLTSTDNLMTRLKNYKVFSRMLCEYIFGSLVLPRTIADLWLICSLNRYLHFEFIKKYHGRCEYARIYNKEQKRACQYPSSSNEYVFYLSPHAFLSNDLTESVSVASALNYWYVSSHPFLLSTKSLWRCFMARCGLTMVSIEHSVTKNHLTKVISKLISFTEALPQPSTEYFFNCLLDATGKDIFGQICRNWISVSRPLFLTIEYTHNRRKSCLEVSILNEDYEIELNIPVNVSITVQEYDGAYEHCYQIKRDSRRSTYDIPTQSSKSRRSNIKRKVLTENGKEIDVDFLQAFKSAEGSQSSDNPVLYIRINKEFCTFFGRVRIDQPDSAWLHQAYIESTPIGHLKAVKTLKSYPSDVAILILSKLIKNNSCWYFVRAAAFESLIHIFNKLRNEDVARLEKDQNPLDIYRMIFSCSSYFDLPKINDFSNISLFLFQISAIRSISNLRSIQIKDATKMRRILGYELLRTLYEYNDNFSNIYSDCCYKSTILRTIGDSLSHIIPEMVADANQFILTESLNILKEDQLSRNSHWCLSFAAVSNIFTLQKMKYIEMDETIFVHCCSPGVDLKLRIQVIDLLVQYILISQSLEVYKFVLDLILYDPCFSIKYACVYALKKHPLFQAKHPESLNSKINTEDSHTYLLNVIDALFEQPECFLLYMELSDFYNTIYGEGYHLPEVEESDFVISEAQAQLTDDGMVKFIIKRV